MSTPSKRTVESLITAIRGHEQQAKKMRATRDRLLAQARGAALDVAALAEQSAGLREILGDLDKEAYEQAFGEPFVTKQYSSDAGPSRGQLLSDWRDLIAFLEATPEIPVDRQYWSIGLPRCESDVERIAAVDAVAMFLGEDPTYSPHYRDADKQQYGVKRMFGSAQLYADVYVLRAAVPVEQSAQKADVDQAEADVTKTKAVVDAYLDGQSEVDQALVREELERQAEAGGEVLDERMSGMGTPAEESADGQVMHAAAYAGPHFGLESAQALCGDKGWLTEDVPLVTCVSCAALLLGEEAVSR